MSDLWITARGETDLIDALNDALEMETDPAQRRALRLFKSFMPGLCCGLKHELDRGIPPDEIVSLVSNVTHSLLETLCATITSDDKALTLKLCKLALANIAMNMLAAKASG